MFMAKSPSRKQSRCSNTEQNNGFGKGTDLLRYDQQFWIKRLPYAESLIVISGSLPAKVNPFLPKSVVLSCYTCNPNAASAAVTFMPA